MNKIAIGSDHAGYELKEIIKKYLIEKKIEFKDFGSFNNERVDYPDFAHKVAIAIEKKDFNLGVLICGSGNGINMTANKHQKIRAALCWEEDIAKMARLHNDANIIALPARYIDKKIALKCVNIFLNTKFEGGRHKNRIEKISC